MAWIEAHQELREHPKTKRLCRLLGVSRREGVGLLLFLWWWAYDYAPDGDLSGFSDDDIADGIDWAGAPDALLAALCEAGWLDVARRVHDWDDYAGRWFERRRADAERKRSARALGTETHGSDGGEMSGGRRAESGVHNIHNRREKTEQNSHNTPDVRAGRPSRADARSAAPAAPPLPRRNTHAGKNSEGATVATEPPLTAEEVEAWKHRYDTVSPQKTPTISPNGSAP